MLNANQHPLWPSTASLPRGQAGINRGRRTGRRARSEELVLRNNIATESTAKGPADVAPERADAASLFSMYAKWFDVVPATTPEQLAEAYRLRYQVYCVENTFEQAGQHTDGQEVDEFDNHSVHSLLIHRPTGMVAGTVRLILPLNMWPRVGLRCSARG